MANNNNTNTDDEAFSKHAKEDSALTSPPENESDGSAKKGVTTLGKVFVFVVFPLTIGVLGLYFSYLETRRRPDKKLSFDQDFMVPFLLALAMAVVIWIQTGGFVDKKVKPLVAWPKVRKKKKIVYKKNGKIVEKPDGQITSNKKDD